MRPTPLALAAAVLLVAAPAALGADYPAPSKPGTPQAKPKGPFQTLKVGKNETYKTIQSAVNAAKAGDTVKVDNGSYKEGVKIAGPAKRYLKLVGNPSAPGKVIIEGKGVKGAAASNGVQINGANNVTVEGFTAQHFRGNGFFVVNVNGYTLTKLQAFLVGTYGVYAFNSVGGTISDSVGAWNNDSGFYVGQTPPQPKPVRTIITNVTSYGNVLGFSGTNMRYVTITKSKFYNNGTGVVPNALSSEKYAPPEENVIIDNDIFWNNFDYYAGAPFPIKKHASDATAYPVGVGTLLFGSRTTRIQDNRIYGQQLAGAGMTQQFVLSKVPAAKDLIGNQITGNAFGLNGTDPNGRDLFYDGNGSNNCISGNTGVTVTVPADASTFAPCPFTGANAFNSDVQSQLVNYALDSTHEKYLVKTPHAPRTDGIVPLEEYATYTGPKPK